MKRSAASLLLALLVLGCAERPDDAASNAPGSSSESMARSVADSALASSIAAHGGVAAWDAYGTLAYDLVRGDARERHTIDLRDRRLRIDADAFTLGYDGADVWVTPGLDAVGRDARFYSSLYFYFFATPFVLADPGTQPTALDVPMITGETYEATKIGYAAGVGDSPGDVYVPHFDTETGELRALLYTVTYGDRPGTRYSGLRYTGWQEVEAVRLPTGFTFHAWDAETGALATEARAEVAFENVVLEGARPADSLFVRPADAQVASPPDA